MFVDEIDRVVLRVSFILIDLYRVNTNTFLSFPYFVSRRSLNNSFTNTNTICPIHSPISKQTSIYQKKKHSTYFTYQETLVLLFAVNPNIDQRFQYDINSNRKLLINLTFSDLPQSPPPPALTQRKFT